jgi:CubicO group peptidase (beta-lactamase class C family)
MKRTICLLFTLIGLSLSAILCATPAPLASFAAVGRNMQPFVDKGTIAGAVTLVASHDRILDLQAVGFADLAARKPLRADDLFWIASMTKPMTAVAVLMLQEEGKLNLEDPVEEHLPEFKHQWLIAENKTNELKLVRPEHPITVRDLLTHTSGLGSVPSPRFDCSLAELSALCSQAPLEFPPGSKWKYSTEGINVLGRIVEVVSGQNCADFFQRRIFDPLGMKDTTFWPTPRQAKRLAKSYIPDGAGHLVETNIYFLRGGLSDRHRTPFPGGGLFSTARDVARFYQMALNDGSFNGKRILLPATLALMTHTQSGEIKTGFTEGMSWGLGFQVVKQPAGVTAMLSPGTFGHGGAYGTQSWADPKKDLILILMIQRAGLGNGDESPMRKAFQEAATAAITN